MKRLFFICGLLVILAVPAASAGTYTGTASALNPYSITVTSTGTLTVTALFSLTKNQGGTLEVFSEPGDNAVCRADTSGGSSLSCDVSGAGDYRVAFWPTKGKSTVVTLTITG